MLRSSYTYTYLDAIKRGTTYSGRYFLPFRIYSKWSACKSGPNNMYTWRIFYVHVHRSFLRAALPTMKTSLVFAFNIRRTPSFVAVAISAPTSCERLWPTLRRTGHVSSHQKFVLHRALGWLINNISLHNFCPHFAMKHFNDRMKTHCTCMHAIEELLE